MGLININKNADYSGLDNGVIDYVREYISSGGITDQETIDAINIFYQSMFNSGLIEKFSLLRLFTGRSGSDALNFVNVGQNNAVFLNDIPEAHTKINGYIPNITAPLRYISDSNSFVPLPVDTLHMHCYNTSSEVDDSGRVLMRFAASDDFRCELIRNQASRTRACIGLNSSLTNVFAPLGYPVNNTGLLTVSAQPSGSNVSVKLYDKGIEIGVATRPPFSGNISPISKMNELNSFGSRITGANIRIIAYGSSVWTESNELNFNEICNELNSKLIN